MLLLWDRNFFGYRTLAAVVGRRAYLLARVASNRRFDPVSTLPDGTYLARCFASEPDRRADRGGITVRVITYMLDDPSRPGRGEVHRLVTTLLDERDDPAEDLIVLYHERWEQEVFQTHCVSSHTLYDSGGSAHSERGGAAGSGTMEPRTPPSEPRRTAMRRVNERLCPPPAWEFESTLSA
jgi:hypothetical protein